MQYQPKAGDMQLTCQDCGQPFYHTVESQQKYNAQNPPWPPPKRCYKCRMDRKIKAARRGAKATVRHTS